MLVKQGKFVFARLIFVFIFSVYSNVAASAKIEYIEIEAEGHGTSLHSAVNNALMEAIAQVHGKTVESERISLSMEVSNTMQNDEVYLASDGYLEQIKEKTKGAVSSYRIISKNETDAGNWRVVIFAKVTQYKRGKSLDRIRLAILPLTSKSFTLNGSSVSASDVTKSIAQQLSNYLVQTRKFAILDRSFTLQIEGELDRVNDRNAHADEAAKLGQAVVADYVLVGAVDQLQFSTSTKKIRTSDKTLLSGIGSLSVSYKIIEVATQQVAFSDSGEVKITHSDLPSGLNTDAQIILAEMSAKLAKALTFKIQNQIFPLAIVSKTGDQVILSQGGLTLKVGDQYKVFKTGESLYDPYTKEFLGKHETYCCIVKIARVTPKVAYADVMEAEMEIPHEVPPKSFILRQKLETKVEMRSPLINKLKKTTSEQDENW